MQTQGLQQNRACQIGFASVTAKCNQKVAENIIAGADIGYTDRFKYREVDDGLHIGFLEPSEKGWSAGEASGKPHVFQKLFKKIDMEVAEALRAEDIDCETTFEKHMEKCVKSLKK